MGVMELTIVAPANQRSGSGLDDQEELFRRFRTGNTFGMPDVADILHAANIDVQSIDSVRFGYFRKIIARIRLADNAVCYAKIALHPYAVQLLEREADALLNVPKRSSGVVAVPQMDLHVLGRDRAIAILSPMSGAPLSALSVLRPVPCPFSPTGQSVLLADHVGHLCENTPDCDLTRDIQQALEKLVRKSAIKEIPVGPAHGDFVYWNVLRAPDGQTSILDFEDCKPSTIAGYDRFYWHILPLTRFSIRRGLGTTQAMIIKALAGRIWRSYLRDTGTPSPVISGPQRDLGPLALALTLTEHTGQMLREHTMADIRSLIGEEALALRCAVMDQYRCLIERLAQ